MRGKGDKERIVPLGRSAQDALSIYLRDGRPSLAGDKNSPFLFIARGAKKITRQRVWQMVSAASLSSGRHASPHMLRHSCATHCLNRGMDIRHVQELLGHTSLMATQKYLHVATANLQATHAKFFPR